MAMASKYKSNEKTAADAREDRMKRLKKELREHIHYLSDFPFLGSEYLRMAASLRQIANVAFMETNIPEKKNPLEAQGKKDKGTLWDQARDEIAVRILLEEGKLNLVMRLLHALKIKIRSGDYSAKKGAACKAGSMSQADMDATVVSIEESLGLLLHYAIRHEEALQILDVPELIAHIEGVMDDEEKGGVNAHYGTASNTLKQATRFSQRKLGCNTQSHLFVRYLYSIVLCLDKMDDDRVADLFARHDIFPKTIRHLHERGDELSAGERVEGVLFLNGFLLSDAFSADAGNFLKTDAVKKELWDLKGKLVDAMLEEQDVHRKEIRGLLDMFRKLGRKFGK